MGCSTQSVPSWSKVAMRCSGGTNCAFLGSVVACTNLLMACFAAPSFQEGSQSDWATVTLQATRLATAANAKANVRTICFILSPSKQLPLRQRENIQAYGSAVAPDIGPKSNASPAWSNRPICDELSRRPAATC